MVQCRIGKRSGAAAIKVAVDLCTEGVVSKDEAICMVEPRHLDQLLHPQFADEGKYKERVLCKGLPASPGAAVGQIVFTPEEAVQFKAKVWPATPFPPGLQRVATPHLSVLQPYLFFNVILPCC